MSGLRTLLKMDVVAAWDGLPRSTQDAIGVLVIKEALLRFAAGEFVSDQPGKGVVYLSPAGRRRADRQAYEVEALLNDILQTDLPELFGCNPSAEHPNGTDPPWAKPILFKMRPPAPS